MVTHYVQTPPAPFSSCMYMLSLKNNNKLLDCVLKNTSAKCKGIHNKFQKFSFFCAKWSSRRQIFGKTKNFKVSKIPIWCFSHTFDLICLLLDKLPQVIWRNDHDVITHLRSYAFLGRWRGWGHSWFSIIAVISNCFTSAAAHKWRARQMGSTAGTVLLSVTDINGPESSRKCCYIF